MKFSLSWLKDHLETEASLETICETLNKIGLEVESVEDPGKLLAPFRTARIISAIKHPNADKLRLCQVDAGKGFENIQVVCGAPNAREGLIGVFAPIGSYIPGSDITLKAGKIRGEASNGMMCSIRELKLGDEHDGIIELPNDTPIGMPYAEYINLQDPIIEIAITPNRGDALSIRNIARDLAAAGIGQLKPWKTAKVAGQFASTIQINNQYPESCQWILGRTIRNVKNGSSPEWLQNKLRAVGLRPISVLVDITNYFTYDLGRPLHVFDVKKLTGSVLTICPGRGETFKALDGKDYKVTSQDCVFVDQSGVQSIGGIMGGENSSVDENTTEIFLECALFDSNYIALSGRQHGLISDARQRFERGIDQAFLPDAIEAATQMILDLCGGEASEVISAGAEPQWQRDATLHYKRLESFGGKSVPKDQVKTILSSLGFVIKNETPESLTVAVPSWRNDIAMPLYMAQFSGLKEDIAAKVKKSVPEIEAEADLIEEVLRIIGLDHVPEVSLPPLKAVPEAALDTQQKRQLLARRVLASRNMLETVGFSFVDHEIAARMGEVPETLRLLNPISSDMDQLRPTPLVSLLQAALKNISRGWNDVALFEVGPAFNNNKENLIAAGIRYGDMPRQLDGKAHQVTLWDVKADVLNLLNSVDVPVASLQLTADTPIHYHPGRSGRLSLGPKNILAYFGELHPSLVKQFGFDQAPMIFEVFLDNLIEPKKGQKKKHLVLSPFQPVKRDFAFVVKSNIAVETLLKAAQQAERQLLTNVELFDIYEGDKVPEGCKSVAIQITLQPQERSLKDEEIEAISQKIIQEVCQKTGGKLR